MEARRFATAIRRVAPEGFIYVNSASAFRSTLSAMFSTAVEDGLLRANPVRGIRIPAPTTVEMDDDNAKALTREELRRFLYALQDDDWRLFLAFLVHTGLRIREAVGLRWEHVDLGNRPRVLVREQFYEGNRSRLQSAIAMTRRSSRPSLARS